MADFLIVQSSLKFLNLDMNSWYNIYEDLHSCNTSCKVEDKSKIKTNYS